MTAVISMANYGEADTVGEDEFENEDEEMDDAEPEADEENGGDEDEDEDEDVDDDGEEEDEDEDEDNENDDNDDRSEAKSSPRRPRANGQQPPDVRMSPPTPPSRPAVTAEAEATAETGTGTGTGVRSEAMNARMYDIVPTMAAPQSTSINAVAATPDMRWVLTGGTDGYVRMYNWVDTANGKVPLTVAQKHSFVDSVMKAGSLLTYWENDELTGPRTPGKADEVKWTSPVYSLAMQSQALWALAGTEGGAINLFSCRHEAGTRITGFKEHASAVSVLTLSSDERSLLSGSWDKTVHDWDLDIAKVKRSFLGSGGQISAIRVRPLSAVPVPDIPDSDQPSTTFSTNTQPKTNGLVSSAPVDEDTAASVDGSLFGDEHNSLFDEQLTLTDGDELEKALQKELEAAERNEAAAAESAASGQAVGLTGNYPSSNVPNGISHAEEPLTTPPTEESVPKVQSGAHLPPQSESTFLSSTVNGTVSIWDRRVQNAVATIQPSANTPRWCWDACWSPDGNFFYVGRKNNIVDEYSIHHLSSRNREPSRQFRFHSGSGPVYALQAMPNGRHLVCASKDILRIYNLQHSSAEGKNKSAMPFTIVPGHRGGVISAIHLDPSCRFMLTAGGNRGWEGTGTDALLGYEIGVQDTNGVWKRL
ncbi:WD40 repeat-like protein [Piedraia hortae CBS 480.64]|uniref:Mitochondrial division protein 1 n=1 Tax=Piedraia hortae CBS 480.64 TaxID=1314780 RepID=A0A6A7BWR5_9PEZI|nr:WD40 repeat-like protein [Piedraia hortae CBS 480.64]